MATPSKYAPDESLREECLSAIRQVAEKLGHSPSYTEFEQMDTPVSMNKIQRHCGSWGEAKQELDLDVYRGSRSNIATEKRCRNELHRVAEEIGHSPSAKEFQEYDTNVSSGTILNIFGSWNEAKKEVGLEMLTPYEKIENPRETCINALQDAADQLGHSPTRREFNNMQTEISVSFIENEFESWNHSKQAAGLELSLSGNTPIQHKREKCIEALQKVAETLGHSPTVSEFRNMDTDVSHSLISTVFGSWNEGKETTGLQTYRD